MSTLVAIEPFTCPFCGYSHTDAVSVTGRAFLVGDLGLCGECGGIGIVADTGGRFREGTTREMCAFEFGKLFTLFRARAKIVAKRAAEKAAGTPAPVPTLTLEDEPAFNAS